MEGLEATRGFVAAAGFMGIVALGATAHCLLLSHTQSPWLLRSHETHLCSGATWTACQEGCVDKPMGPRAYTEMQRQHSMQGQRKESSA